MDENRSRIKIGQLSVLASILILALKGVAYWVSNSTALKSDALEGIVNVVAACFALGAILFAEKPADKDHPYGHGKIEYFSAAFEGGLISLAAALILIDSAWTLIQGPSIQQLELGLAINLFAGALNGALGWFLIRKGKKLKSRAIEADGHHVLSDFWTTLGIGIGLLLVKFTGWLWLDPVVAILVALQLAKTGYHLVQQSAQSLLDQEDPQFLEKILATINSVRPPEVIALHGLRSLRYGRFNHVDVHIVVPENLPLRQVHDVIEHFSNSVLKKASLDGELHTHMDPCQKAFCEKCLMPNCAIRQKPHHPNHREILMADAIQSEEAEIGAKTS